MKYNSVTIENFRGLRSFTLPDIKQVNLLAGRNNCGKTSILEGLFLISGMSNPQLPVNINLFRDLALTEDEDFSYIFHNLDFDNLPRIRAGMVGKDKKRELKIIPIFADYRPVGDKKLSKKEINPVLSADLSVSTSTFQLVEGLKLEFGSGSNQKFGSSEIRLKQGELNFSTGYKEKLRCAFINTRTAISQLDKRLGNLLVQKNLEKIITVLQEIEPPISDIRMANNLIYVDIGLNKLMPINIMGDGIRRMLAIIAAISDMKGGVLLIDEIENGFHYSSLQTLWKAVFRAAQEYDVQIFATTHSYECITAFASLEYDDICLYRIDRQDNQHTAFAYNAEVLRAGISKEFEVR